MKILIKYQKEHFHIELEETSTVRDLKREIAKLKHCKVINIKLVYAADVLKNSQKLKDLNILPEKPVTLFIDSGNPRSKSSIAVSSTESAGSFRTNASGNNIPAFSPPENIQYRSGPNTPPTGSPNAFDFSSLQSQNNGNDNGTNKNSSFSGFQDDVDPAQFSKYIQRPEICQKLQNKDVQAGLELICQGLELCQNSGNHLYDKILTNLRFATKNIDSISTSPPPILTDSKESTENKNEGENKQKDDKSVDTKNEENDKKENIQNETEPKTEIQTEKNYEELYADTLQLMDEMELCSHEKNLEALIKFNGDMDEAVEWIISEMNS
ncbi:hypothetical protein TRFO_15637 [Tritrichomonas foetus]|uniref:Ubiquitin-like domain-containing protein n=1 Tax=Tritrichomonas foetus TaxID=1144522 RepID=A0A1J4KRV9_9EUKA|nr:hypothetical protein TRFO_15637 [Tritrichomonas foetus]|eukprot:OHT14003.1 hypothetical protein TRFO_15637 [Tritrichomonas foetus]